MTRQVILNIIPLMALIISVISFIDGGILYVKKYRKQNVLICFAFGFLMFVASLLGPIYNIFNDKMKAFFDSFSSAEFDFYDIAGTGAINLMLFLVAVSVFFTASFIIYIILSIIACMKPKNSDGDFILIHGCHTGMHVSPILKNRVDKALEVYRNGGEKAMFALSGGKGSDEPVSEACAMHDYLLENGVPQKKMFLEDESTTTLENIMIVREMTSPGLKDPLYILVSDDYHVLRASIYARKLDMRVKTIGAKTKYYYWFYGTVREFLAIVRDNKAFFAVEVVCFFMLIQFLLNKL